MRMHRWFRKIPPIEDYRVTGFGCGKTNKKNPVTSNRQIYNNDEVPRQGIWKASFGVAAADLKMV